MNRVGAIHSWARGNISVKWSQAGVAPLRAVGSNAATHPPGWVSGTISIRRM